jgi:Sulfotransferase family
MTRQVPEASVRDTGQFSPIFVLTTARSYSSVVTTMIGQHPALAGFPELKLFCYPTIGELEASLPRFWLDRGVTHRSPGVVRAVAQFEFGDQELASLKSARTWLCDRSHWSGADVLDVLMGRLSPRNAVEKSPENVESDAALRRLMSAYPKARYLHLTRHPVATQRSLKEHLDRRVPGYSLPDQPMSGIAFWVETHCRILRFTATLPKSRYMRIRGEDVLNDPRSQLRSIAAWLGVQTDEHAIEAMLHPEASPFASFGPEGSGIVGGNDPNFLRDPIPRPVEIVRTLQPPPGWEGNSSLWQMTVEIANRLGYP